MKLTPEQYMQRAIELASNGLLTTMPNPRVGCILVKDNQIVAEAWHQQAGEGHAEVLALEQAGNNANGSTCYVTLEPCCHQGKTGPCSEALISAGVKKVMVAMQDPNPQVAGQGIERLRQAGITVEVGLLEYEATALNPGFIKRMRHGVPWVRSKQAMSLDGKIALANGQSQWLTAEDARHDNQYLRASSCAVVTGIGTVLADNPQMNVRLNEAERQPLRVIVDSQLRCPVDAVILQAPGSVLIATTVEDKVEHGKYGSFNNVEVQTLPTTTSGRVDLLALMQLLAERECNEVHLEAGSQLTGAFLQQDLIDEMVLYMAPLLLGDKAQPLLALPELTQLDNAPQLQFSELTKLGKDVKIRAIIQH